MGFERGKLKAKGVKMERWDGLQSGMVSVECSHAPLSVVPFSMAVCQRTGAVRAEGGDGEGPGMVGVSAATEGK